MPALNNWNNGSTNIVDTNYTEVGMKIKQIQA